MKKVLATVLVGVALATSGCTKMVEGHITRKSYDDPDTWTSMQCAAYNSKGICTVYMPVQHYDGPHWSFELNGTNDKGEPDQGWVEVGADEYNVFGLGDCYPGQPGMPPSKDDC